MLSNFVKHKFFVYSVEALSEIVAGIDALDTKCTQATLLNTKT